MQIAGALNVGVSITQNHVFFACVTTQSNALVLPL